MKSALNDLDALILIDHPQRADGAPDSDCASECARDVGDHNTEPREDEDEEVKPIP